MFGVSGVSGFFKLSGGSGWRKMIGASLLAFGGLSIFAVLRNSVDHVTLALCLGTLCLAEVLSALVVAGWGENAAEKRVNWQDALERTLARWIVLCVLALGGLLLGFLSFFDGQPLLVLACLGLSLCLALLKLTSACRADLWGGVMLLAQLRWLALATVVFVLSDVAKIGADLVVALAILTTLSLWMVQARGLLAALSQTRHYPKLGHGNSLMSFAPALLRYVDLLILPVLLSPEPALLYIAARSVGMLIEWSLDRLTRLAKPGITMAYEFENPANFVSSAARLNLGILLVGGGVALGVLSAAPYFSRLFGSGAGEFRDIVVWVIVAQSSPAIFGAASLLLDIARHRREVAMIRLGACLVFSVVAVLTPSSTGYLLALHYAFIQLSVCGMMAGLLAWRSGIWPGITAVLFKQIRLF